MQAFYDHKPAVLEAVGDGSFMYRWNIEERIPVITDENIHEEHLSQWACEEVVIWPPVISDKVIVAVIRSRYSAEQELSLVNKFNSYQQGMDVSADIVDEYMAYLSFVAGVKRNVRKDLGEEQHTTENSPESPRICDLMKVVALTVNTFAISDADALRVKSVYPSWNSLIGKEVKKDEKMQYDGRLWKVLQPHTVQEQNKPGTGTESLYTEIVETASGTADDPIPYNNNMELEQGKYYIQDGIVYRCTRNTDIPVYQPLADLVGIYVERVSE